MKKWSILILIALLLPFSAAGAVDFPKVEGWKIESEVKFYGPDNLWEYINGAAELFLGYDFQGVRTCDLAKGELIVTVDIYDMGTPLNAFGVYNTEKPRNVDPLAIGGEGIVAAPYQCLLLKGNYYVKVNMYEGEINDESGKALLTALANALPGEDGFPAELNLLPGKDRIAGSEIYVKEGFLGLSELSRCVAAKYPAKKEKTFQAFYMIPTESKTIDKIWTTLEGKWKSTKVKKKPVLFKQIPYKGYVGVIRTDKGIFGVSDSEKEKEMKKRLEQLIK